MAKQLNENYRFVLVGTNDALDKRLPDNILSIHRTQNQSELAEIYTAADVFVNPTREDTFPTVNLEALACGTPVITFGTGGSPECIDESCGIVVPRDDVVGTIDAIEQMIAEPCEEACRIRAQRFAKSDRFMEYIELYSELL